MILTSSMRPTKGMADKANELNELDQANNVPTV
jgi:hypothetical protein